MAQDDDDDDDDDVDRFPKIQFPFFEALNNTKYCENLSITISPGSFMQEEAKKHILRSFAKNYK